MKSLQINLISAVVGGAAMLFSGVASAAILKDEKGLRWVSNRDLSSQRFSELFDQYSDQGYMMIDIDAYPTSGGVRYSMVWRENADGRGWAEHRGLTSDGYNQRWRQYRDQGFRPHDIETWMDGSSRRWAGIWVENREGLRWSSHRNLTHEAYGELFQQKSDDGFRLLDMEAYRTGDGMRYAAIWIENRDNRQWAQLRNMTRESYQQQVTSRSANGFHVVDFEAYETQSGLRYAAIWERKPGFAWQTRTNRTEKQFANLWREYLDKGYRLVDFERYDTPSGPRYGGVWAENASRFRHPQKGNIDGFVSAYQSSNGFPGVSVAVIQDGEMIYRRGFGDADINDDKDAWGGTVYGLASVSKAIGGTLAAKLESEGRLQDGRAVNLDLTNPTSQYLTNIPVGGGATVSLPNQHTHTVEQLLAHLGCVVHYPGRPASPGVSARRGTTPGVANQTTHYNSAIAAAQSIWSAGLVTDTDARTTMATPCTVGTTRSYSTHAFTLVGAVLERVTGRTIQRLVNEEIADQYGLGSMRTMYTTASLPANRDRASWYSSATNEFGFSDNSWKVLGGGIESSVVDLARLGWKALNGEIVDARTRDCRMWSQTATGSSNGVGWDLDTSASGRRIADHGGDAGGMDAYIRVYRDDGLVIAILANRDVSGSPREQLADNIEGLLLSGPVSTPTPVNCAVTLTPRRIIPAEPLQRRLPATREIRPPSRDGD